MIYTSQNDIGNYAWAAGFIDGEGCIHIAKRKPQSKGKSIDYDLTLKISNQNLESLKRISEIFDCGNVLKVSGKGATYKYKRQMFQWQCYSQEAGNVLKKILPFLTIKKQEAKLAIEFLDIKKKTTNYHGLSNETLKLRDSYYLKMREFKNLPAKGDLHVSE